MGESVTSQLSKHLSSLDFDNLPPEVVTKAQHCLLDSLGCMIGGTEVDEVRRTLEVILSWGQAPEARVPGLYGSYPASIAAYAAAQLANALDYDDTVSGVGHPGAAIIATALAVGQERGSCGEDLITAIVAGYDAAIRIGRSIQQSEQRAKSVRGHTWAIFGSVASAALLLKLSPEQCQYALGFAAQHAPVPFVGKWYERPITSIKNNYGWAAMGGVTAAKLAELGAEGNRDVLDGDTGFWIMASSDRWHPDAITAELGERYAILDVEFKPFAACRYTHSGLDALRTILAEHEVEASSITRIVLSAAARAHVFADYKPKTLLDAQFSFPWVLARTVLRRPLKSFDPQDAEVAELAKKVEIVTDEEAELKASFAGLPAAVEVHLQNGQIHVAHTEVPPGTPARALSEAQIDEKFATLTAPVIGSDRARALRQLIRGPVGVLSAADLAENYRPTRAS